VCPVNGDFLLITLYHLSHDICSNSPNQWCAYCSFRNFVSITHMHIHSWHDFSILTFLLVTKYFVLNTAIFGLSLSFSVSWCDQLRSKEEKCKAQPRSLDDGYMRQIISHALVHNFNYKCSVCVTMMSLILTPHKGVTFYVINKYTLTFL
jgi:hypothetical protein